MKLLPLYDKKVKEHIKKHGRTYTMTVKLTPEFLKYCRARIIEGHKKYGNDWVTKDCLLERLYERYDDFNYTILDKCQMEHQAENHPLHIG